MAHDQNRGRAPGQMRILALKELNKRLRLGDSNARQHVEVDRLVLVGRWVFVP